MSKTLGLALGAGGTRGIAHVGFLKALEEADIRPDYIAGSSMGSVVGACYSKGMTCDEMRDIAFELNRAFWRIVPSNSCIFLFAAWRWI